MSHKDRSDIGSGDFTLIPKLNDTRGICVKLLQTLYRAQLDAASRYRDVAAILCKMGLAEYRDNGEMRRSFRKVAARRIVAHALSVFRSLSEMKSIGWDYMCET